MAESVSCGSNGTRLFLVQLQSASDFLLAANGDRAEHYRGSTGSTGATGPSTVSYTSNDSTTNLLQKLTGAPSKATDATTSDVTGLIGIASSTVAANSTVLVNTYTA